MADKSSSSSRGPQTQMAHDGHRPRSLITEGYKPAIAPGKVQGGYQAPGGGGKPAAPTTGSGVTTSPAAPAGGKK
jgi:hypothetical protein